MSAPDLSKFRALWEEVLRDVAATQEEAAVPEPNETESSEIPGINWKVAGTPEHKRELEAVEEKDMIRFVNATAGDAEAAVALAKKACLYRAAVRPREVTSALVPNAMSEQQQGVYRVGGWTKCGYPVLWVDSTNWMPSKYYGVDEYIRNVSYVLEIVREGMGPGVGKFVAVMDLSAFTSEMVRPIAVRCIANLLQIIQEVHCERLAAVLFMFYNRLFYMSWKVFKVFFNKRTIQKVHWVTPKWATELTEDTDLKKWIDADQLEKKYGGDLEDGFFKPITGDWETDMKVMRPAPPFNPDAPQFGEEEFKGMPDGSLNPDASPVADDESATTGTGA